MSPYREPGAKHVCEYERYKYVPPHNFVRVCRCGEYEPPNAFERALDAATGFLVNLWGFSTTAPVMPARQEKSHEQEEEKA